MRHGSKQDTWARCWVVSGIAAAIGFQLWPHGQTGDGLAYLVSALLWLVSARTFFTGVARWKFARELGRLRRIASKRIEIFDERRFDLLVSQSRPDVAAIIAESNKIEPELRRDAARRRLMLLEAGVHLPNRW